MSRYMRFSDYVIKKIEAGEFLISGRADNSVMSLGHKINSSGYADPYHYDFDKSRIRWRLSAEWFFVPRVHRFEREGDDISEKLKLSEVWRLYWAYKKARRIGEKKIKEDKSADPMWVDISEKL